MDTLKFRTFANSPKSQSANPSKFQTQLSLNPNSQLSPYNNIPQLKKQMQAAINSRRASRTSRKSYNKYPQQISIMKSDISLLSAPQIPYNLPLSVLQLQVGVTQEILAMRQDKLTLMEQYNKILQNKYRIERQITKLKKAKISQRSSQINEIQVFDNQNSSSKKKAQRNQTFIKNQNLKQQFQSLKGQRQTLIDELQKQQQQQMLLQIENLQQNSRILSQKISKIQQNIRPSQQQRFQTFFPDKYSSTPPKNNNNNQPNFNIQQLQQKRTILLKRLANQSSSTGQKSYFLELIDQNQQLLQKIIRMNNTRIKTTILDLSFLRQKVSEQKQAKQLFFEDLKKFKEQARKYRQQNQQMKARLQL